MIKKKREDFIAELCQDIEHGKDVNWGRFKKLKDMENKGQKLDVFDMKNFCIFFSKLCGQPSLDERKIMKLKHDLNKQRLTSELVDILDSRIILEKSIPASLRQRRRKPYLRT